MLITILFIAILIIGISMLGIWKYLDYKAKYSAPDSLGFLGIIISLISFAVLIVFCIIIAVVQITKERDYEQALYEKQIIEYRIEKEDENIVGNELLYNDIVEFNNKLRTSKRYANDIWINWFYNDKIATIEYIEIPCINIENKENIC